MPNQQLRIKVNPNARTSALVEQPDGTWLASVRAAPVDGRANAELIALVAKHFGCPRSAVKIRSGTGGRHKHVTVNRAR